MKSKVSDHWVSKSESIFLPNQCDGSISNLKCFPCFSQVIEENLHIGILVYYLRNIKVSQCFKPIMIRQLLFKQATSCTWIKCLPEFLVVCAWDVI